jgi:molybdenum cofactor synthesis domain-containing protein
MTEVQLLDKSEVWLHGVHLSDVNLPDLAHAAAAVLNIARDKVFVTDVRPALVVLDILQPRVDLAGVTGKQAELLSAVAGVAGVTVDPDASVHSEGILGVIGTPREEVASYLEGAARMQKQLADYAARRVAVVSTGPDLLGGQVEDTNFAAIHAALTDAGYEVEMGGIAGDSEREIAGLVARLSGEGFGLIITTGGVGAEDKDRTIEAIELLDPELHTAVLARYTKGHGRHVKDCVRIAIARLGWSTIVALPGPTHEVKLALPVLRDGMANGAEPATLIEAMAVPIRATLPQHGHGHGHRQGHGHQGQHQP